MLVENWISQKMINGVKDCSNKQGEIINDVTNYSKWLSEPKVSGTRTLKVKIYFTINTNTQFRELIENQIEFLQQERMRVDIKRTADEHTQRVGVLIGPIVDRANLAWYARMIEQKTALQIDEFESKKDVVYEGDKKQWCIVVMGIYSQRERIDFEMRKFKLSSNSHINYISFANNTRNERI